MNRSLLDRFIDCGGRSGKQSMGGLFVWLPDRLPEFFDLGAQGGFVFLVDRPPAQAAAVLPDSGMMMGHNELLDSDFYDRIDAL